MSNSNRVQKLFVLINYLKTPPAKSIRNVSQFLGTSCRTVYRHLELLEQLGFRVEKDSLGKFLIPQTSILYEASFTWAEVNYLISLLKKFGNDKELSEILINKLTQDNHIQFTPYFSGKVNGNFQGNKPVHLSKN